MNTTANSVPEPTSRSIDSRQHERLVQYLELLLRENQLFNLTAIDTREEAWARHVVESLQLLPLLGPVKRLLDVGSGGGVPGMVLAIARPDLEVTLLEATGKKARFLEQTARTLGLENLNVVAERAELAAKVGSPLRECFDVVTARAVAPLRVLLELATPFSRVQGLLLAVKGEQAAVELAAAAQALSLLNVAYESSVRYPTATIVILRKHSATPTKYPRRPGEPKRNPL